MSCCIYDSYPELERLAICSDCPCFHYCFFCGDEANNATVLLAKKCIDYTCSIVKAENKKMNTEMNK